MAAHKRTTSDSSAAVFVPHALCFAGAGEEEDKYHAAQRYDWDDVPPKLAEPRAPYELTQPFDYVIPKKAKKVPALGTSNGNTHGEAEAVVRKKMGRPRKDAALAAAAENTPAQSVEPEGTRSLPKRRGRPPRRSEASRKTDDGDNTADESYVQPGETWKAGTKRRGPAPPHQPSKRPRISKTAETDDEQETAPLRSGGARSRTTPLKPQQANRWSNTEDRQLIDSLFEVLGSIPWRRVTAYMADRGYSCADRGEGAIRGRWKVLRPRLYIVPPPVVRGAAAKSQMKARERETVGRDEGDGGAEEDEEADADGEDADEGEMEVDPKESDPRQPAEEHGQDTTVDVEGDTTVEEDDVPPRPQRNANVEEKQQSTPTAPKSTLPGDQQSNAQSLPPSNADARSAERRDAPSLTQLASHDISLSPPLPPNLPHTSPNPPPFTLLSQTLPHSPAVNSTHLAPLDRSLPRSPNQIRYDSQLQPSYTSPNLVHHSPPARESKESRFYQHPPGTSRLSEHPAFRPDSPPRALSPIRHPPSPDRQTLPPLSSQLLSPAHRLPTHGYPAHLPEDRHLTHSQEGPLLSSPSSRHLTHPPPLPLPQQYSPAPVWPARIERTYEDNPFDDQARTRGERGFHPSGDRGFPASPERVYQTSGERERERGHHTSPGREYQTSSERERYQYEGTRPRKGRKPEMLPFPVTHAPARQKETANTGVYPSYSTSTPTSYQPPFQTSPFQAQGQGSPYQGQAAQVFPPPPLYVPPQPLFTTQELAPGGSRLPMLGERAPLEHGRDASARRTRAGDTSSRRDTRKKTVNEPRRTREATYERAQSSSQGSGLSEVPDSTAGDSDL